MIGKTVSHYRILEKLGAGGMGVVYKAEDTRLGRFVALKFLPEELAKDRQTLERFEREARAAARLNHPYIAAVFDVGQAEEARFIVQEYVEGETLRVLLSSHRLPLRRAVELSIELAEALVAAHTSGVTHRDLKPENVMVTKEGHAKVLDFGLAKVTLLTPRPSVPAGNRVEGGADEAPTADALTGAGVVMGTVGYMAPEQAQGRPTDHRGDHFSFGCVLYEMVSGRAPFAGRSNIEKLQKIVHEDPPRISDLTSGVPRDLERIVQKCLAKDPAERYQHAEDLVVDLRRLRRELETGEAQLPSLARPAVEPPMRLSIRLPSVAPLSLFDRPAIALSSDGLRLVYVAELGRTTRLYIRAMDRLEPVPIDGSEAATGPFFSADGQRVGFFADGKLKHISTEGGTPLLICDAAEARGACWTLDNRILFAPTQASGLWEVPAAGGTPQPISSPELQKGEVTHRWPEILPDGTAALFTIGTAGARSYDEARVGLLQLGSGERRVLAEGGTHAKYLPTGHLAYVRSATLLAAPFNLSARELRGSWKPILEGIATEATGAAHWAFSTQGWLAYVPGRARVAERAVVWVNRKGAARPLPGATPRGFEEPRLSPDGRWLAVGIREATSEIWLLELKRGTLTRLTFVAENFSPIWTPDGERVTFSSTRSGPSNIYWTQADGSGTAARLLESEYDQVASSWSPDGRVLAFTEYHPETGAELWTLPVKHGGKPQPFRRTPYNEWGAMFSPNGRWLAYTSDESGRPEVYVQPFPRPTQRWQISTEGGSEPLWARNGRELYYRNGDKLMGVTVATAPSFRAGNPRLLFSGRFLGGSSAYLPNYDVAANNKQFVMIKEGGNSESATQINVILGWFDEVLRRAPR